MIAPTARNVEEIITDRLLLLYMIHYLRGRGFSIRGTDFQKLLKINKLLYFAESRMYVKRIKSYNYHFRKWDHGPFAQEAYLDIDHLNRSNFIKKGTVINMQDEGKILLKDIDDMLMGENKVIDCIERVVREYGEYSWDEIKSAVYAYPTINKRVRMEKVKKGTAILNKLEFSEAEQAVQLNPSWFDTLKIMLSPHMYSLLKEGIASLQHDQGEDFDEFIKTIRPR